MFQIIVLFIMVTLGFVCVAVIYGKDKSQNEPLINKYLVIIIAFQSCRFLAYGISLANPEMHINWLTNLFDVLLVALMPCFYLYFQNIVLENKFKVGNLIHFVVSVMFVFIFMANFFVSSENGVNVRKVFLFTGILFYLFYAYLCFILLNKNIWRRKSDIKAIQKQNELIRNWSIFLYVSFIVIAVIRIITGFFIAKLYNYNNEFLWITALIWIIIFIKILLTPEILYGYNFLNKTIDTVVEKVVLNSIWKIDGTVLAIANEKDKKMEEKISSSLSEYIHQIEAFSFHGDAFRNPELSIEDIASGIKKPVSHVSYLFKFHCKESFTDYKKIVRIHDAIKLLEKGYLNEKTVESLAETVGFSSYITFYHAFKSITGVTTQEYVKRL